MCYFLIVSTCVLLLPYYVFLLTFSRYVLLSLLAHCVILLPLLITYYFLPRSTYFRLTTAYLFFVLDTSASQSELITYQYLLNYYLCLLLTYYALLVASFCLLMTSDGLSLLRILGACYFFYLRNTSYFFFVELTCSSYF